MAAKARVPDEMEMKAMKVMGAMEEGDATFGAGAEVNLDSQVCLICLLDTNNTVIFYYLRNIGMMSLSCLLNITVASYPHCPIFCSYAGFACDQDYKFIYLELWTN